METGESVAAELRTSEAEWRQLIETLPQIVWVTRPDGWHTHFNRKWMDFTGLTLEESLGFGWNPPFHPDDRGRAAARWAQATSTGEPYEIEYRLRGADGTYRWMLGRAMPLRDESGTVVKWFGTCTDIEDLKQAQALVEESRSMHRLAGSMARLGGWSIRVPEGTLAWSEEVYGILDYPAELVPTPDEAARLLQPGSRERLGAAVAAAIATGERFDLELELRTYTGRPLWIRVMGEARPGPDGRVTQITGALQDISDQHRNQAALRERVKELRALATISGAAHALTGADELCEFAARSLVDAMQHPAHVSVRVELGDGLHRIGPFPDGAESFTAPVMVKDEERGHIVVVDTEGCGFLPEEQELVRTVAETLGLWKGRHRAAAELQRVNDELNDANEQLAGAARLKDDLLSMASHELRTPLTPILGFTELLEQRGGNLTDAQRQMLRTVRRNGRRMLSLVDDLLVVSRATVDVLASRPEAVSPREALATVLDELGDTLSPVDLDVDGTCRLHVDPQHFQQIVTNLLTNATKYGAPPIQVRVRPSGTGRAILEVEDRGPGIPPEFRTRMWERFEQKDSGDTRTSSGTGLGLAIVRLLAEVNGGTAGYRDASPSGSIFTIDLPAVVAAGRTDDEDASRAPVAVGAAS